MTAKSIFSRNSYVHWPSPFFDEEIRQHRVGGKLVWVPVQRTRVYVTKPTEESTERQSMDSLDEVIAGLETALPVEDFEKIIPELGAHDDAAMRYSSDCFQHSFYNLFFYNRCCYYSAEDDSDDSSDSDKDADRTSTSGQDGHAVATAAPAAGKKKKGGKKKGVLNTMSQKFRDIVQDMTPHIGGRRSHEDSPGLQGNAWWIGRRGDALVGLCCTSKTRIVNHESASNGIIVCSSSHTCHSSSHKCSHFIVPQR